MYSRKRKRLAPVTLLLAALCLSASPWARIQAGGAAVEQDPLLQIAVFLPENMALPEDEIAVTVCGRFADRTETSRAVTFAPNELNGVTSRDVPGVVAGETYVCLLPEGCQLRGAVATDGMGTVPVEDGALTVESATTLTFIINLTDGADAEPRRETPSPNDAAKTAG